MKFDSNRAWQQAVTSVSANRDVLFPVAGVFFLLPAVLSGYFMADLQAAMMQSLGDPEAMARLMDGHMGSFFGVGLATALAQAIGGLALLALLTDRTRPTVGQAIGSAIRALPTLIGAGLVMAFGYLLLAVVFALVSGGTAGASSGLAGIVLMVMLVVMVYVTVKLSLLLPVVVIERVMNPLAALARSWRITRGNSFRIFAFYALLFVTYIVLATVATMLVLGLFALVTEPGALAMLFTGVVSGTIGAIANVLFIAVLAAVHRQLAGPSAEAVSRTFE
ncbi:MAG: glycerophosphoryl diester phosphodiesterase membrane domain-containing protein [Novosphingobium sp.]